jgi:hypothetical protein
MSFLVRLPRSTYNVFCRYLQEWEYIYRVPGSVVLPGCFRKFGVLTNEDLARAFSSEQLSDSFSIVLHALGQAKVLVHHVVIDLRDLDDEELAELEMISRVVAVGRKHEIELERSSFTVRAFRRLPAMVRIAIAAKD